MSKEVGQNWYLLIASLLGVHTKNTISHLLRGILAISAPMIYTAPCVMLLMQAVFIVRTSERGVGPGNQDFLGPVKWHRAVRRVLFGAPKTRDL